MTNAALSVTQSAVEQFTEQYLRSHGCAIQKYEEKWEITIPEDADTSLSPGDVVLHLGEGEDVADDVDLLHPESEFFEQLLADASDHTPVGKVSIDATNTEIQLPEWLRESDIAINNTEFTPYYDRTAAVVLYRVSIETVSEYQTELLHAVAIDTRSEELLPELEDTFLISTTLEGEITEDVDVELGGEEVSTILDDTREPLIERIQPKIDEIHEEASRAADAEVEEYRQMQQQRLQELEDELATLSSRIDDLSQDINSNDDETRVQALKERKELKSEQKKTESELADLRERRDQGYPERQQEIRERHALDVVVTPLTLTEVEYERGEIDIELADGANAQMLTVGYGSGIGVTEEVCCPSCDWRFGMNNPPHSIENGIKCQNCG